VDMDSNALVSKGECCQQLSGLQWVSGGVKCAPPQYSELEWLPGLLLLLVPWLRCCWLSGARMCLLVGVSHPLLAASPSAVCTVLLYTIAAACWTNGGSGQSAANYRCGCCAPPQLPNSAYISCFMTCCLFK
jgi:hypothetical protein